MTPQEILASLSRLESELNEVASARLLVEQTTNSYKEVQKELRYFIGEFQIVTASLNMVAKAFQDGKASLATEVTHSIEMLKAQLETINNSFSNQCNSVIVRFVDSISNTSEQLKSKTSELTADYSTNNDTFKSSIKELATVYASLVKASESVSSLKTDISTLQLQLQTSQKGQDKTLEKIASDLQASSAFHTAILQQISNDLKSSQDAQDEDLNTIRETTLSIATFLPRYDTKSDKLLNEFKNIQSVYQIQSDSLKSRIIEVSKTINHIKIISLINLIVILAIITLVIVK